MITRRCSSKSCVSWGSGNTPSADPLSEARRESSPAGFFFSKKGPAPIAEERHAQGTHKLLGGAGPEPSRRPLRDCRNRSAPPAPFSGRRTAAVFRGGGARGAGQDFRMNHLRGRLAFLARQPRGLARHTPAGRAAIRAPARQPTREFKSQSANESHPSGIEMRAHVGLHQGSPLLRVVGSPLDCGAQTLHRDDAFLNSHPGPPAQ